MKLTKPNTTRGRRNEGGSAVLVVFVLLLIMAAYLVANSMALHVLKQDLDRVERQQLRRWEVRGQAATNAVPGRVTR